MMRDSVQPERELDDHTSKAIDVTPRAVHGQVIRPCVGFLHGREWGEEQD